MLTIPAPFDAHVHFRQGDLLRVARHHDRVFEFALVMPNTDPPILDVEAAQRYRSAILKHCQRLEPLMTLKLTPTTSLDVLRQAARDVVACKLYPDSMTTNSHGGFARKHLEDRRKYLYPLCDEMQRLGLVLSIHGEMPPWPLLDDYCLDREQEFLPVVSDICREFPRLRVVLEHVTTQSAMECVSAYPNLAATVTYHHLLLTLNDVIGVKVRPHNFCLPTAKRPSDRAALRAAVLGRHGRVFLGSDSAPHPREKKECAEGCAGCYTAPLLLEGLVELFDQAQAPDSLAHFVSEAGRRWYHLPEPAFQIHLEPREWVVPEEVDGCVPFRAGQSLKWSVVGREAC